MGRRPRAPGLRGGRGGHQRSLVRDRHRAVPHRERGPPAGLGHTLVASLRRTRRAYGDGPRGRGVAQCAAHAGQSHRQSRLHRQRPLDGHARRSWGGGGLRLRCHLEAGDDGLGGRGGHAGHGLPLLALNDERLDPSRRRGYRPSPLADGSGAGVDAASDGARRSCPGPRAGHQVLRVSRRQCRPDSAALGFASSRSGTCGTGWWRGTPSGRSRSNSSVA